MDDKDNATRAAWATIKLNEIGTRSVGFDRVAVLAGPPTAETVRPARLTWRNQVDVRDGMMHLDLDSGRPRRYEVEADGQRVGGSRGCGVDMYLVALGKPVHVSATRPATGTPITADITGGPDRTDAEVCSQQPFFASAAIAAGWLAAYPEGHIIRVADFHDEARRMVVAQLESSTPA